MICSKPIGFDQHGKGEEVSLNVGEILTIEPQSLLAVHLKWPCGRVCT
jgi:hypothetical protein